MPADNFLTQPQDKLHLLRRIDLFTQLTSQELQLIADSTRLVEFKKDEVIYYEGDPADALYVVISGRLKLSTAMSRSEQVLTYLHRGDSFGEISLLTGESHSATVRAINDTLVLMLTKDKFDLIIDQVPALVLHLSRVLSRRLRRRDGRPPEFTESTIVSVYSAAKGVGSTVFALSLALSLKQETNRPAIVLDMSLAGRDITHALGLPDRSCVMLDAPERMLDQQALQAAILEHPLGFHLLSVGHRSDGRTAELMAPLLSTLTDLFGFIIADVPTQVDETVLKTLVQSDRIYMITDGEQEHLVQTRALRKRLEQLIQQADRKVRIVLNMVHGGVLTTHLAGEEEQDLGYSIAHVLPRTADHGEPLTPQRLLPLIERPDVAYAQAVRRIARDLGGVLVGLALGSGAALGLAHIGLLKVFEREKIPVDLVAGCSMGALIASFWATGKSAAELEAIALRFRTRGDLALHLLDPPFLPWRGMFPGKGVVNFLHSILGDKTFDDTWLPLRVVAANPYTRERIVFHEGCIADAVRASVSIPGIFLPVIHEGNVYLDGGISSPVPVSVLRSEGAQRIIAVNVFPTNDEVLTLNRELQRAKATKEQLIAQRSFPVRLAHWIGREMSGLFVPFVTHILMRSMQAMEFKLSEMECQDADLVVRPTIPGATWDEFYRAARFIKRGEEAAEEALPRIKQLLQV